MPFTGLVCSLSNEACEYRGVSEQVSWHRTSHSGTLSNLLNSLINTQISNNEPVQLTPIQIARDCIRLLIFSIQFRFCIFYFSPLSFLISLLLLHSACATAFQHEQVKEDLLRYLDQPKIIPHIWKRCRTKNGDFFSLIIARIMLILAHESSSAGWKEHANRAHTGQKFSESSFHARRLGSSQLRSRDGDLSASTSPPPLNQLPSKLFFSFSLATDPASVMQLPRRLDLGVGDSGIIGRKVSVMTSSTKGPMAVAEGVIGWN